MSDAWVTRKTGRMPVRLSIGDFAKMTYLSIKSLRRYHDMGLLVPAEIDPASGYRYYEADQVAVGQVIRRFRDLGMPLEQVREVLNAPDAAARNAVVVAHLRQMESALQQTQQTVSSLRALLERRQDPIEVEYRSAGPMRVLAIAELVAMSDIDAWWSAAFSELHGAAAGLPRTGPDGALYSSAFFEDDAGEVTAFVPIGPGDVGRPAGRVHVRTVPGGELAVTVHAGSLSELDQTYGALGTFVSEREIGVPGPIRENYLVTSAQTPHESQHRTEVCWPVFHIRGEGK
jgi:DNA-binding transcriptional MerR regulator/effector-binding domain-containing protein